METLGPWIPVIIIVVLLIIMAAVFVPHFQKLKHDLNARERLKKEGQKIKAKVLQVVDRSLIHIGDTQLIIQVETKYGVKATVVGSSQTMAIPKVGSEIEVLCDPNDPSIVVLP